MARTSKARRARREANRAALDVKRYGIPSGLSLGRSSMDTRELHRHAHTAGCHVPFPRVRLDPVAPRPLSKADKVKLARTDRKLGRTTPRHRDPAWHEPLEGR